METSTAVCIMSASTGQRHAPTATVVLPPEEKHRGNPTLEAHGPSFDELSLRFTYSCRFDGSIFKDVSSTPKAFSRHSFCPPSFTACPEEHRISIQSAAFPSSMRPLARTTPRRKTSAYHHDEAINVVFLVLPLLLPSPPGLGHYNRLLVNDPRMRVLC
ncbi:hypothetical protein CKAH01_03677 [Colletotrichum kahawae]|uniref:Uncharacterized protein n=1 Tax=Colletotrichum kahawae TaxID=34407 RepID=A0AAE0DA79_COLKA|nr:hypothetical protein CKAH01_03677 [Colletotrichum kahawae]